MIERGQGNLLEAQVDALVNTVNTEGVMGKGIALQFKKAFPSSYEEYRRECDAGRVQVGKVLVCRLGTLVPRYIIQFPTKKHWRNPSKIEYVKTGLVDLVEQVKKLGIRSIAVPPLGCGNGGLAWADVYPLLEAAFEPLPDVRAILFAPAGAPEPAAMPNLTKRPRMTAGRAAVLAIMERYLSTGYDYQLSFLEIQKLAYFLQSAGQPLKLDYHANRYGPYADELRHVLNHIEGHFTQGFGDGRTAPETPITLLPGASKAATEFLAEDPTTRERLNRVASLIEGFETPLGMELLATVHWVMQEREGAREDVGAAIEGVHAWNSRKAKEMKPVQIRAAWGRLRELSWA
jgi:O-acetyl-ADP-ribose deacetylase (regulator of RNase III)